MTKIILNAVSFLLTILLAFFLKKMGVLKQTDGERVSKIVIFTTLPATIIVSLNAFQITSTVWILMSLGLIFNLLLIFVGYLLGRKNRLLSVVFICSILEDTIWGILQFLLCPAFFHLPFHLLPCLTWEIHLW
ncbi:hypothetical protein [Lactococcus sp. dk310]|uniref:hypothetical protein n=1 Tax=Lactococcus sp. dk310 TaxID=2603289 RepID=UPI002106CA32|nr:hypothetical protein [Lactococcus sp. dk310]